MDVCAEQAKECQGACVHSVDETLSWKTPNSVVVEAGDPLGRVHPEVGQSQTKAVVFVVHSQEPPPLKEDEVEYWGCQNELGELLELVIAQEADVPIV